MVSIIENHFGELTLGERLESSNLSLFPVFSNTGEGPSFMLMDEALERGFLEVTEISVEGSVNNLRVANRTSKFVLLPDGQELCGAKQNRVLNTSVLCQPHSEIVVPVSCTERNRWSYHSRKFGSSELMMAAAARSEKAASVHESLAMGAGHSSDQREVWKAVKNLLFASDVSSETLAMKDVYVSNTKKLDDFISSLEPVPGQVGSVVYINGKLAGCEILANADAYSKLHPILMKSYAVDAIYGGKTGQSAAAEQCAETIFDRAADCQEEVFDSVGAGIELRFKSKDLTGFALVYEDSLIHASLFPVEAS